MSDGVGATFCIINSPPPICSEAHAIEIAYFTFPGDEGRGVAAAMAACWRRWRLRRMGVWWIQRMARSGAGSGRWIAMAGIRRRSRPDRRGYSSGDLGCVERLRFSFRLLWGSSVRRRRVIQVDGHPPRCPSCIAVSSDSALGETRPGRRTLRRPIDPTRSRDGTTRCRPYA